MFDWASSVPGLLRRLLSRRLRLRPKSTPPPPRRLRGRSRGKPFPSSKINIQNLVLQLWILPKQQMSNHDSSKTQFELCCTILWAMKRAEEVWGAAKLTAVGNRMQIRPKSEMVNLGTFSGRILLHLRSILPWPKADFFGFPSNSSVKFERIP